MGRPPCWNQVGINKGPWTPEEDIILVFTSRDTTPATGDLFHPIRQKLHAEMNELPEAWDQARQLLPSRRRDDHSPPSLIGWAAIASYLPLRTDKDIKNYWNTHFKKKLKKLQLEAAAAVAMDSKPGWNTTTAQGCFKDDNDSKRKSLLVVRKARPPTSSSAASSCVGGLPFTVPSSTTYASSTKNISRLLEGWMKSSPKSNPSNSKKNYDSSHNDIPPPTKNNLAMPGAATSMAQCASSNTKEEYENEDDDLIGHEELESLLSFENMNNVSWEKLCCDSIRRNGGSQGTVKGSDLKEEKVILDKGGPKVERAPLLMFLEKWLLDEKVVGQVEEMMELPSIF